MKDDEEIERKIREYCSECEAFTHYQRIYVHERAWDDEVLEKYTLVACENCGEPALLFSEEVHQQREIVETDESDYRLLWSSIPRVLQFQIPEAVARPYKEACHAELMKRPIASAVMIGRAFEAMCKDFDSASRSIADGLRRMRKAGALSNEIFEWAIALRVIQNEISHASHVHIVPAHAIEALDCLQIILELLYKHRPRYKLLKARLNAC